MAALSVCLTKLSSCRGNYGGLRRITRLCGDYAKINRSGLRFKSTQPIEANKLAPEVKQPGPAENRIVGRWLIGCSGMVFGAVVIGGVTRLTGSGLSMVHWHAFKELPPLSEANWEAEFERYQQFPEYKIKNRHMTLGEFKFIWWMEYIHRQWGRLTGLAVALPTAYFLHRGYLDAGMKKRVIAFLLLIGFQGYLGWYMVQSGLKENPNSVREPSVSQYRLAAHLGTAFVLYTLFLYNGLNYLYPAKQLPITDQMLKLRRFAHITKGLVFLTAFSGAFVAGLQAGLLYNTFPKMADNWVPDEYMFMRPRVKNFTENPVTAQFNHRILAMSTVGMTTALWWLSRSSPLHQRARVACTCLAGMGAVQVGLGISTLLMYVPTALASLHQCGSLVLLSFAVWVTHELRFVKRVKVV